MSFFPAMFAIEYLGLVDVHLIRRIYFDTPNQMRDQVEELVEDLNEIAKSRVEAIGGNCLVGYKVLFNTYQ